MIAGPLEIDGTLHWIPFRGETDDGDSSGEIVASNKSIVRGKVEDRDWQEQWSCSQCNITILWPTYNSIGQGIKEPEELEVRVTGGAEEAEWNPRQITILI